MDLFNGEPVIELSGDEFLPKEGFVNQKINRLYVREVTLTKKTPRGCCGFIFQCSSWGGYARHPSSRRDYKGTTKLCKCKQK